MHYSDYLHLDKILGAQFLESEKRNSPAHDEMLFIIIHQTYELWFKQLLFEISSVNQIMQQSSLNDNSPELQTVVHRLSRSGTILKLLVHQIDVMETMTPMDFLDFRDILRPASGFQSWQFKELEATLGLKYAQRYGQEYYISKLRPGEIEKIKKAETEQSLLQLVNSWLERMPFFNEAGSWKNFESNAKAEEPVIGVHTFWKEYRHRYQNSLAPEEQSNAALFDFVFFGVRENDKEMESSRSVSPAACRSALFIMLYRGYPMLQLPFQLLNQLLEIDEQLSTWRYRHMNMVHRTIGTRIGTGGSSGREYLKNALDKHYIFKEIAQLNSFLIERKKLPKLSSEMEQRVGFLT
ncbi:MAG: tryptophan 2,3-dioxygenase [Bacteroidetes bacterium]|nr:MAG: tryptophan 2,3-dioxygenase [Bacteroidota bacterium]